MDWGDKKAIRAALEAARDETRRLAAAFSDEDLETPAASYLSPPNWDLGHIANFEELWLVQNLLESPELRPGFNDIYDAFKHDRAERPKLKLLSRSDCTAYQDEVRERALAVLESTDTSADAPRLTRNGFVHWMIVLHEHQHQETLLQSLAMRGPARTNFACKALPEPGPLDTAWVEVSGGTFTMGHPHETGHYDNEADAHEVRVEPFAMARYPVTVGEYIAFIEDGGYRQLEHWSDRGRTWLEEGHQAPLYWFRRDGQWWRRDLRGESPILHIADEILCHVTFFEAEAYASWVGARLPTEAEWECAAQETPPDANLDHSGGPSCVGAYGPNPQGIHHMLGDVWEWCDSGFEAYPGFEAFPYDAYSKVFFGGDYRILRGGSWAAKAPCASVTFRNWDHPYRRQIFSGIRLAR